MDAYTHDCIDLFGATFHQLERFAGLLAAENLPKKIQVGQIFCLTHAKVNRKFFPYTTEGTDTMCKPISMFPEAQPFVEMRRSARRRDDALKVARGFVVGIVIGAVIWAAIVAVIYVLV